MGVATAPAARPIVTSEEFPPQRAVAIRRYAGQSGSFGFHHTARARGRLPSTAEFQRDQTCATIQSVGWKKPWLETSKAGRVLLPLPRRVGAHVTLSPIRDERKPSQYYFRSPCRSLAQSMSFLSDG